MNNFLYVAILVFILYLIYNSKKAKGIFNQDPYNNKVRKELQEEGKEFVTVLEKLDYFKYTDPSDLHKIKNEIIEYYDPEMGFFTYWKDEKELSEDYRILNIDWDTLNENDSISKIIKNLHPSFQKIGVQF